MATIRRLQEIDLLMKEDICAQDLLFYCNPAFVDFFADWDPGALKTKNGGDSYAHHCMIQTLEETLTELSPNPECHKHHFPYTKQIINASFRHYPDELGLLMLRNDEGNTVWKELSDLMGSQKAWEIITNSIDGTSHDKVLEESSGEDQNVSFAPLFIAAVSSEELTVDLSILYHLLQKEPAQWFALLD